MKIKILTAALCLFAVCGIAAGQTTDSKNEQPAATPADVASIDAILKNLYAVISGDAGVKRDWDKFRSLFYPEARLIPTGKYAPGGKLGVRALTPEQYIEGSGPYLEKNGFHEVEIGRRTLVYGSIAHVFSTYESRRKLSDKTPFMRGINSIQLFNDGKRWWIVSVYWQAETPENPLSKEFLKFEKQR